MSLLFSSQVANSPTPKRRGGVPTQSLEFQIREYIKWVFTPKPKLNTVPAPAAARPASTRPQGGRS